MRVFEHETQSYKAGLPPIEGLSLFPLVCWEIMSSNKDSDTTVQRRVKPSEHDPLPREKLPESLQKIVDNEESLMDQLYDGTYVEHPFWIYLRALSDRHKERTSLQIPILDTQHMQLDSAQFYSVRTAMLPTPLTLESLSARLLIRGLSKEHTVSPGHTSLET